MRPCGAPDTAQGDAPGSRIAAPLGLLFSANWNPSVSALKGGKPSAQGNAQGDRRNGHLAKINEDLGLVQHGFRPTVLA
jgi:hypothetical protein